MYRAVFWLLFSNDIGSDNGKWNNGGKYLGCGSRFVKVGWVARQKYIVTMMVVYSVSAPIILEYYIVNPFNK